VDKSSENIGAFTSKSRPDNWKDEMWSWCEASKRSDESGHGTFDKDEGTSRLSAETVENISLSIGPDDLELRLIEGGIEELGL
jgi:hypothetical protein